MKPAAVEKVTSVSLVLFRLQTVRSHVAVKGKVRRGETAVPCLPMSVCVLKDDSVLTGLQSVESLNARMASDSPTCMAKHTHRHTHSQAWRTVDCVCVCMCEASLDPR